MAIILLPSDAVQHPDFNPIIESFDDWSQSPPAAHASTAPCTTGTFTATTPLPAAAAAATPSAAVAAPPKKLSPGLVLLLVQLQSATPTPPPASLHAAHIRLQTLPLLTVRCLTRGFTPAV
jgi:hypothetical protein